MSNAAVAHICFGRVMHRRLRPIEHVFSYGVFFLSVPLSSIPSMARLFFSLNRWNLLSFHERDFGPRDGSSLDTWARQTLAASGVDTADGEIVLQAFPRVLGYVFNPIAIWYCHDREGKLRAALCEVNNTFGERHNYVVAHPDGGVIAANTWLTARKVFHVSPFCEVRGHYRFRFEQSADRAFAQIDYYDGPQDADKLIVTTLHGAPSPISAKRALSAFLLHPFMTLGVIARIHWQAIKLWRQQVPFFSKPAPPSTQTTRSALSSLSTTESSL
jgi:DUF1365 family protein